MINNKKFGFTLAGATHVAKSENIQNSGFTLAEVLITLGIIGVVAAITMPTLIQNYQKQVYVNQLKKSVSTLEQGFRKMMVDEGVDKLSDLPNWKSYDTWNSEEQTREFIDNLLKKEFNVVYSRATNYVIDVGSDGSHGWQEDGYPNHMQFNDGCAIIDAYAGYNGVTIVIDVNGVKKPNKLGRDIFEVAISDKGKLYPLYGREHALLILPNQPLETNPYYWKNSQYHTCTSDGGSGCAARIMENGWKMDY